MNKHEQMRRAERFRSLHDGLLVLPNAWDPISAFAIAGAGAPAIATSSAAVSWAHAFADGGAIGIDLACDAVERVLRVVEIPVSADIERGYAETPAEIAANVRRFIDAGVVGINLEDFTDDVVVPITDQVAVLEAVSAARQDSGVPIFVNARTDVFLKADPSRPQDDLFDEAVERASAYAVAGADGLFVTGVRDLHLIGRLCEAVGLPVNVGGAGALDELAKAGVRRVSWGPQLAMSTYAWVRREAASMLGGTPLTPPAGLDYGDLMRRVDAPALRPA